MCVGEGGILLLLVWGVVIGWDGWLEGLVVVCGMNLMSDGKQLLLIES